MFFLKKKRFFAAVITISMLMAQTLAAFGGDFPETVVSESQ